MRVIYQLISINNGCRSEAMASELHRLPGVLRDCIIDDVVMIMALLFLWRKFLTVKCVTHNAHSCLFLRSSNWISHNLR